MQVKIQVNIVNKTITRFFTNSSLNEDENS